MSRFFQIGFFAALAFCAGFLHAAPLGKNTIAASSPGEARKQVLAAAAKYEHTPYRYGGIDRRGLDCSGLVYLSFQDALGVSIPRNTGGMYSWVEKIRIEEALPGDLVFFKTGGSGAVSHVGILVGGRRFIHAASEGPSTGVIYSSLDERYWSRTYVGTGRALPEAELGGSTSSASHSGTDTRVTKVAAEKTPKEKKEKTDHNTMIGIAVAPTWHTFVANGNVIRGVAGQFRLGTALNPFGQPMILGIELRPEWDGALGVFRVPLTLSWGVSDKVRVFAGPVLSFGDAALTVSGENRQYYGGTSWLGAAGVTVAPFALKIAGTDLSPYAELAWQSYFSENADENWSADFAAGFRFSTGLRFTWKK